MPVDPNAPGPGRIFVPLTKGGEASREIARSIIATSQQQARKEPGDPVRGISAAVGGVFLGRPAIQTLPEIVAAVVSPKAPAAAAAPIRDRVTGRPDISAMPEFKVLEEALAGGTFFTLKEILECAADPLGDRCRKALRRLFGNKTNQLVAQILFVEFAAAAFLRAAAAARGWFPRGGGGGPAAGKPQAPSSSPSQRIPDSAKKAAQDALKSLKDTLNRDLTQLQKRVIAPVRGGARAKRVTDKAIKRAQKGRLPRPPRGRGGEVIGKSRAGMPVARPGVGTKTGAAVVTPPTIWDKILKGATLATIGTVTARSLRPKRRSRAGLAPSIPVGTITAPAPVADLIAQPVRPRRAIPGPAVLPFTQLAPSFARAGPGTTTAQRQCLERRRKPGKCAEGYFKETPRTTRYTVWRERDCVTRAVTKRSKK